MCYVTRNIYTVCAHSRVGELIECKEQVARNDRYHGGGCWANFQLSFWSCRPAEKLSLEYSFCGYCRDHYRGYDTNKAEAILNYWAFKNRRGYCFSVSPSLIPAECVFRRPAACDLADAKQPRCELIALDKALPRRPFETPAKWLQRLEGVRTLTLKLAEEHQEVDDDNSVIRMQPRITSPMPIDPYARVLSPVPELSESQTTPHESQGTTRVSPQVHLATLQKLCGEVPPEFPATESEDVPGSTSDNPQQQTTALRVPESSPLGHEVSQDTGPTTPGYHHRQSDLKQDLTKSERRNQESADSEEIASPEKGPVVTAAAGAVQKTDDNLTSISLGERSAEQPEHPHGIPVDQEEEEPPNLTSHFSWDSSIVDPTEAASTTIEKQEKSSGVVEQSNEPNMTSCFSVSDIDPDDAADIVSPGPVSPVSEVFSLAEDAETRWFVAGDGKLSPVEGEQQ
ncbi:hypothetical protein C8A03DRAFT_31756, partial [Achaetomium macrosporum]